MSDIEHGGRPRPGPARGRLLSLPATAPVLILTRLLGFSTGEAPFYLAKAIVSPTAAAIAIEHP